MNLARFDRKVLQVGGTRTFEVHVPPQPGHAIDRLHVDLQLAAIFDMLSNGRRPPSHRTACPQVPHGLRALGCAAKEPCVVQELQKLLDPPLTLGLFDLCPLLLPEAPAKAF